jgi:hypothetical protein
MANHLEWITQGSGRTPQLSWSFATDASLCSLELARESGEVLAADASGGIYLLDRNGQIASVTRGQTPIRGLAWSDNGSGGVALIGNSRLHWFSRQLEFRSQYDLEETALAVAIDSHGEYVAASLSTGMNLVFDGPRKPIFKFSSQRPFVRLCFVADNPGIIGIADYGLLSSRTFAGGIRWEEKLWSNAGDIAVSGSGEMILIACFSHGTVRYDDEGNQAGSYQVEGTPSRVSCSYLPYRIAVATVERQLYWMNSDGKMLWAAETPEDITRIACDPLGKGLVVGFESGQIVRLDWGGV